MSTPADPRLPKDDLTGTGAAGTPGAPRRVVVAEDETLIRLDLMEMLVEEGFEVATWWAR